MKNIGLPVKSPKEECADVNCPFHGKLPIRGRLLEGKVIKNHMQGTVMIRRDYLQYVPKYLRYTRRHSHIAAHNPPCIETKVGDKVKIMECRPLSKSVSFVIIEKMEST